MNKLTFLMSILRYSLIHPKVGIQLLQSRYDVLHDSKNKKVVHQFENPTSKFDDVVRNLFPAANYSIIEFKKNLKQLEDHVNQFFLRLENEEYPSKAKPYPFIYALDSSSRFLLYVLCRILKPEKIVETGVAYGLGSSYILQALHENKKGKLYSIDSVFGPWESKQMIGTVIPDYLRERWNLIYGSSSQKLKKLLTSLSTIDIFFHDSLHTYRNMMFEFNTAWPFISDKGLLLSDDISANNAFYEFCSKRNLKPIIFSQENKDKSFLGIICKP